MLGCSKISQKSGYLFLTQVTRMGIIMKIDVAFNPLNISLVGADTVMWYPNLLTHQIQKFQFFYGRLLAMFEKVIRLRFFHLSRCFYYNRLCYTPEKLACKTPFRVSTLSYVAG